MPGARCARSLVCKKTTRSHRNDPAFPAQWFYGLLRALPGDQACLTPSPALLIADLTPALGRQNDTTSPSASARSSHALPASTASRPALMTLRNAPLRDGTVRDLEVIWVGREEKYFCKRGLTRFLKIRSDLPVGLICRSRMQKFDLPRRQISKQQDVPATAVGIIGAIRLPCRPCSRHRFSRAPELHTEGR